MGKKEREIHWSTAGRGEAGGRCHVPVESHDMHQPIKDSYYAQEIRITNFHLVISRFTDHSPPSFLENLLTAAIPQNMTQKTLPSRKGLLGIGEIILLDTEHPDG